MFRKLILLTGIPATGKTTIGNYLRDNHDYHHIDFEDKVSLNQFASNPLDYLESLKDREKIVISWGFVPEEGQISLVEFLVLQGFKLIWFEGDHVISLTKYIERDKRANLDAYYYQMFRILSSKVVDRITPQIINTYNDDGGFRKFTEIVKELDI